MLTRKLINRLTVLYCMLLVGFCYYSYNALLSEEERLSIPIIIDVRYGRINTSAPANRINANKPGILPNERLLNLGEIEPSLGENDNNVVNNNDEGSPQAGYDFLLRHANRLGYAVPPEYQKLPMSWEEVSGLDDNFAVAEAVKSGRVIKILLHEKFNWWDPSKDFSCPQSKFSCQFDEFKSSNETLYSDETITEAGADYEAVVIPRDYFHGQTIGLRSDKTQNLTRILYTLESPMGLMVPVKLEPRDYLASYWRGSDIYAPYFKWQYHDPKVTQKDSDKNYAEGRTKMAAIVVSNCVSSNSRLEVVQKLQEYIQVDVYGACGDDNYCDPQTDCFDKLKKDYKFYLAFENSNCRDYITEKFYSNGLHLLFCNHGHDMIPIVMGAHPSDYVAVAPENSYIHVDNFKNVKELAEYLKLLNSNDTLYNEYFGWRGTGSFVPSNFACELCDFMHLHEQYRHDEGRSEVPLSYLNSQDPYDSDVFMWSSSNQELCLGYGESHWNR